MASKDLVHVTDTLHIIPLPQNMALKHSWVILLPGQQHSQDFRPYVHTKASRGVSECHGAGFCSHCYTGPMTLWQWLYSLHPQSHTMTGDRMLLNDASYLGRASCQEASVYSNDLWAAREPPGVRDCQRESNVR